MKKEKLPEKWSAWLQQNLRRGCCNEELVQILCGNGFGLQIIKSEMGCMYPAYIDFKKISNADIVHNSKAEQIKTDKAQIYTLENFLI
ncbi:hypothetical protein [Flocculibacter collagenilyticus]|uniref:hypothetical protein n=1 Tax=Flocculibacter collagenilyticus TaxID=2744479 RepID=UPI0018F78E53|nr:hypothetical protein [Flocculibacter collagenilyticus]